MSDDVGLMKYKSRIKEAEESFKQLAGQVGLVMKAIKRNPSREQQILMTYVSHFYEAVKEAIKKQGSVVPYYITLADPPDFGPRVTNKVIEKAKALGAKAIVSVEGFQSDTDIGDVVFHVSMSVPSRGVLGWVLKVKHSEGKADIVNELPYLFNSPQEVKTLGELVKELEDLPED